MSEDQSTASGILIQEDPREAYNRWLNDPLRLALAEFEYQRLVYSAGEPIVVDMETAYRLGVVG